MWQEITAQINDVVHETRSLPAPTGELGEVKTHIDQLPAAMQQVEDVQHLIIQHIERSTELTNTALLKAPPTATMPCSHTPQRQEPKLSWSAVSCKA